MTETVLEPAVITEPGVYQLPADERRIPVGDDHSAIVDAADLHLVAYFNWRLLRGHNGKLYAYSGGKYMHRLIAGTPQGMETDHINGDGLDNRRANLRAATPSQNRANIGKPRRPNGAAHSSQYKGVSWDRSRSKWQAKIAINGHHQNLGRYADELAAAAAYDRAATAAWGDFAQTNGVGA